MSQPPQVLSPHSQYSAAATAIVTLFRARRRGDLVTYDEINAAVGKDVRLNRGPLNAAIRRLRNEGVIVDAVRSEGYMILTTENIVNQDTGKLGKRLRSMRRTAKRAIREVVLGADPREMSPTQVTATNHTLAHLGTIEGYKPAPALPETPKPAAPVPMLPTASLGALVPEVKKVA